jgi:hypothetical protein
VRDGPEKPLCWIKEDEMIAESVRFAALLEESGARAVPAYGVIVGYINTCFPNVSRFVPMEATSEHQDRGSLLENAVPSRWSGTSDRIGILFERIPDFLLWGDISYHP